MKKGIMFMLLSAVLSVLCLAGCGNKAGQDQVPQGEGDIKQHSDATGTEDKNVKLKFWCDKHETALYQEMIDAFIGQHSGEATIEVEYEAVPASDCKDVFLADIANGADLFNIPDDQLLTMVASGLLEEIQNAQTVSARNIEGAVEAASVDGKLYAYPISADNGYFLFYDKNYLTQADVQTLDRILKVCEEKRKKLVMDWSSGWYLYTFFGETGMQLSINEDGLTNFCDWNKKEGEIKGVDVAQSMLDIANSPGFLADDDFETHLRNGNAIAIVAGVWELDAVQKAFGTDYGACKLPTYTCAGKQVQMASFTGYRLLGVNSYSQHREWAEKLADYLTNEENQNLRFERAGRGPSNQNAASSEAVSLSPAISAVFEQAEYGVLQKVGQKYWTPASTFGNTMAEGNPGNLSLQDLLDQLVSGITSS